MSARSSFIFGVLSLLCAFALSTWVITPLRSASAPGKSSHQAIYQTMQPGEFAGTLMLGGFRGLACDLLWMRAQNAKDSGRFYESVALSKTIVQVQPRFEQIWEYLTWDMAYNIAAEVEDTQAKWSWYVAGLNVNVEGARRNPHSERLVRHLAWMFQHKGDNFRDEVEKADFSALINPLLNDINANLSDEQKIPLFTGAGYGNFQYSERLYRATVVTAERNKQRLPPFVRRMIPIAIERDGNRLRNRGQHFAALQRYVTSLDHWHRARAWSGGKVQAGDDALDQEMNIEMSDGNIGRLTRKIELLSEQLSTNPATQSGFMAAIREKNWTTAVQLLSESTWKTTVETGRIRWLDEP
jgi:nucleoid DNA-binding protein